MASQRSTIGHCPSLQLSSHSTSLQRAITKPVSSNSYPFQIALSRSKNHTEDDPTRDRHATNLCRLLGRPRLVPLLPTTSCGTRAGLVTKRGRANAESRKSALPNCVRACLLFREVQSQPSEAAHMHFGSRSSFSLCIDILSHRFSMKLGENWPYFPSRTNEMFAYRSVAACACC
jgi:hypothetical protein